MESAGLPISRVTASGGIARKDPFFMQLYADVLGKELRVSGTAQGPALGTAISAAVAAGVPRSRVGNGENVPSVGYRLPSESEKHPHI